MFPEMAFSTASSRIPHPGTVTFVGSDGMQRTELAEHIPDWIKFAPGPDGSLVPVVRVVRYASERGYTLRSYSEDGRLLWVGMMVPPVAPTQPPMSAEPKVSPRSAPTPMAVEDPQTAWDRAPFASQPTGWF